IATQEDASRRGQQGAPIRVERNTRDLVLVAKGRARRFAGCDVPELSRLATGNQDLLAIRMDDRTRPLVPQRQSQWVGRSGVPHTAYGFRHSHETLSRIIERDAVQRPRMAERAFEPLAGFCVPEVDAAVRRSG